MATQPLSPSDDRRESQGRLAPGPVLAAERNNDRQRMYRALRTIRSAEIVIAIATILAICYFGKLVLVTIFASALIAFILEPLVRLFQRIRIPRPLGAGLALLVVLILLYGLSYFFYQRAVDFMQDLPKVSGQVRQVLSKYQKSTEKLKQSTEQIVPTAKDDKNAVKVKVQQDSGLTGMVRNGLGPVTETLLTIAFIPFLVYFMLTWQDHARAATVKLFAPENRTIAYVTMGKISDMMRGFIAGNFAIGVFMSIFSAVLFALLGIPYFYFVGFLSGFLSLMPYLGVILAMLPPLALGIGHLHSSGLLAIAATVLGLHVFAMNVLYPKVIGSRLQLNPLVVTIALLVWGWIWGAMGLILAVPIMGALKIIFDHIDSLRPLGEWMGE